MGSTVMTEDSREIGCEHRAQRGSGRDKGQGIRVGSRGESRQTRAGINSDSTKEALEHDCEAGRAREHLWRAEASQLALT